MKAPLKYIEPNSARGAVGLCAYFLVFLGAGVQWGFGVAAFSLGLLMWVDANSDEVLERITGVCRGKPPTTEDVEERLSR